MGGECEEGSPSRRDLEARRWRTVEDVEGGADVVSDEMASRTRTLGVRWKKQADTLVERPPPTRPLWWKADSSASEGSA